MLVLFIVLFFTEMYRKKGLAMLASSNKTPWMLWLSWLKGGGGGEGRGGGASDRSVKSQ